MIGRDGSREEVIQKYVGYLQERPDLVKLVKSLLPRKSLMCWCRRSTEGNKVGQNGCHADILLQIANEKEVSE